MASTVLALRSHAAGAALALRWRLGARVGLRPGGYVVSVPARPGFAATSAPLTLVRQTASST